MKMEELIKNIFEVLESKDKLNPVEIQASLNEEVVIIQIHKALKQLVDEQGLQVEATENGKYYSISKRLRKKNTQASTSKGKRDLTTYQFNGQTYNKSRLALAIIARYCKENNPSHQALKKMFPVEIIKPYGLFRKKKDALEMCKDRKRFFIREHEIIGLSDGAVCVSNQFTTTRIEKLIEIATNELGYKIK